VFRSLRGLAPGYFSDFCHSVSTVPGEHLWAHQPMASYLYLRSKLSSMETAALQSVALSSGIGYHPPFTIAQFLARPSRKGWELIHFSAKNYGQQKCVRFGVCLHFREHIKCSVIIIINAYTLILTHIAYRHTSRTLPQPIIHDTRDRHRKFAKIKNTISSWNLVKKIDKTSTCDDLSSTWDITWHDSR